MEKNNTYNRKGNLLLYPSSEIIKRLIDILIGGALLILLFPLILLLLFWIRFDSPGNPIFTQQRIGRNGKPFVIYKMRTLFVHHFGIFPGEEPEPYRITSPGKFLRRVKLDELPQLLNVVIGNMSLVGPRPDIPEQVSQYTPFQNQRLLAKPGMTGITQISGNTTLPWPARIKLDVWYIENWSLFTDLKILVFTLKTIFSGETLMSDPFRLHAMLVDDNTTISSF